MKKSHTNPHFRKNKGKTIFVVHAMAAYKHDFGSFQSRTFGWFSSFELADKAVRTNQCDIYECLYQYVIIEEIADGIHGPCYREWWYKWDKEDEIFESVEKPIETKNIMNWSMG